MSNTRAAKPRRARRPSLWRIFLPAVLSLTALLMLIAYQCIQWLRSGVWESLTIQGALDHFRIKLPHFDWVIPERMLTNFVTLDISMAVLGISVLALLWGIYRWDRLRALERRAKRDAEDRRRLRARGISGV